MILSRFHVDIGSPQGRECVRDCQNMHRSITRLFHCARKDGNILYRFNPDKMDVYVLSEQAPDLQDIPKGMKPQGQKDMSAWEAQLAEGQQYRFNLLAAPMKKVAEEGIKNSRRRFLRSPEERMEWLARKAEQAGFVVTEAQETNASTSYGKHAEDTGGAFYLRGVCYQGVLQVSDAEKFRAAWKNGVGSGRAYGQGLLLLTKI